MAAILGTESSVFISKVAVLKFSGLPHGGIMRNKKKPKGRMDVRGSEIVHIVKAQLKIKVPHH